MEINLSFDQHGRIQCKEWEKLDFTSKSISTNLASLPQSDLDDLLYDAEIADCGLMPRTFWMPATKDAACWMEQLAQQVFQHHTEALSNYDAETSGAEWWVQIRPSPPNMGRYDLLVKDDDEASRSSVSFHWDKDEDLRILAGGDLYAHPHISTVTYLTNLGAPTMVMEDFRINNVTGEWMIPEQQRKALVSWPRVGKHLSFDGRLLHAAPSELMNDETWQEQIKVPGGLEESVKKLECRRRRRVTFLVNIWLNYKPFNIDVFPMPEKMTKAKSDFALFHGDNALDMVKEVDMPAQSSIMTWPMGGSDSKECIRVKMDRDQVQMYASIDTLQLSWKALDGVVMAKGEDVAVPIIDEEGQKRERQGVCETDEEDERKGAKKAATSTS
jgi:hypothetical protein